MAGTSLESLTTDPLSGQIALVTGVCGRLGPIWCRVLREAGATVIETDHPEKLGGFFGRASAGKGSADLACPEDVRALLAHCQSTQGAPTILVNNAGVDDRPTGIQSEHWPQFETARRMAEVNLLGTYHCLQVFGTAMAAQGRGSIINVASLYGLVVPDDRLYSHLRYCRCPPDEEHTCQPDYYGARQFHKHPMYGATKAAIISLTKYFAAFWGPVGVRVNALAPGGVVDPNDPLTGTDEAFRRKYTAKIPMGRMCTPDDLGGALVFLASSASSFITGHTLVLDGGFSCL